MGKRVQLTSTESVLAAPAFLLWPDSKKCCQPKIPTQLRGPADYPELPWSQREPLAGRVRSGNEQLTPAHKQHCEVSYLAKRDLSRTLGGHIWLILYPLKSSHLPLAGVAQWIEHWPANQRVAGSIPSQGTCLGCRPGLQWVTQDRQPHIDVSLLLSLPSPLSKK